MHVTRLRLAGFKSFVEPADFPIEAGLTGVIGPNGCGKSNLLEALRWVMGAASAKAMRGEGMDDVIFSGSSGRASRSHAEVTLTLDNADRTAPAAWANEPVLQVARRIDRGAGSTYRINGREVRARDVQLLFADASTGANSPALVRQGQISELIAARPSNRRRILEEAAGVAGLHGRRHEAQLRVRAAEANLARLDDLAREVGGQLRRLEREARAAARYRQEAARIRKLEAALAYARWAEAAAHHAAAREDAMRTVGAALDAARAAAAAASALLAADAALPPLRDEAAAAAAVNARLALEADRAERELTAARETAQRLAAQLSRLDDERARETQMSEDAAAALARLAEDIARTRAEIEAAPERRPALEAAAQAAQAQEAAANAAAQSLSGELAAAEASAKAQAARAEDAARRCERLEQAARETTAARRGIAGVEGAELDRARAALAAAMAAEVEARERLEAAEAERRSLALREGALRTAARAAEDAASRARAAAEGLAQVAGRRKGPGAHAALAQVRPEPGHEAALAAAFGDDLAASLDPSQPAHWRARDLDPPDWPDGARPLGAHVTAPPALAAALAFAAIVEAGDGPRLAAALPAGARLVTLAGDLWRWDGLVVRADAPRPAQAALEQRTRLAALEAEAAALTPAAEAARNAHAAAVRALATAEAQVNGARGLPAEAARRAAAARETLAALERRSVQAEARTAALDETLARLALELEEARRVRDEAGAPAPADLGDLARRLTAAREAAARAREPAFAARQALEREIGARAGRLRRLEQAQAEAADWGRRAATAAARLQALETERSALAAALDAAWAAPEALERRRLDVADQQSRAVSRQADAAAALETAERARTAAERAARAADAAAADAREARAAGEARLEAAVDRLAQARAALEDATGEAPEAVGRRIAQDGLAVAGNPDALEAQISGLRRDLEALGPVNLRAETEAAEIESRLASLGAERADLDDALGKLRQAIDELNAEGRERLIAAFEVIDGHFRDLFTTLFDGGAAELRLVEADDPLDSGLEIFACPPGKRLAAMSLMSGGEQALTAVALIFAVFLANPAPICVLDEVDAPLDDANVDRFCDLLDAMRSRASTRFLVITHNPVTMSRMDRLFGVTMREKGVSQLVSVDLREAEALAAD